MTGDDKRKLRGMFGRINVAFVAAGVAPMSDARLDLIIDFQEQSERFGEDEAWRTYLYGMMLSRIADDRLASLVSDMEDFWE